MKYLQQKEHQQLFHTFSFTQHQISKGKPTKLLVPKTPQPCTTSTTEQKKGCKWGPINVTPQMYELMGFQLGTLKEVQPEIKDLLPPPQRGRKTHFSLPTATPIVYNMTNQSIIMFKSEPKGIVNNTSNTTDSTKTTEQQHYKMRLEYILNK